MRVVCGLTLLLALGVCIALRFPTASHGQGAEEGLLELHVATAFASLENPSLGAPFESKPLSAAGLSQDCEVYVFNDLSNTRMPNGTAYLDVSSLTPLSRSPVNQDGSLYIYLPAGRYSIIYRSCIPVDARPYIVPGSGARGIGLTCCPRIQADPPLQELRTESGDWVSDMQTIDVPAGGRARVSMLGLPEEPPSRKKIWTYILISVGLVVGGAVVASLGALRPRFNPTSRADRTQSLPPNTDPDYRPADFDDVFGDFLKKR